MEVASAAPITAAAATESLETRGVRGWEGGRAAADGRYRGREGPPRGLHCGCQGSRGSSDPVPPGEGC